MANKEKAEVQDINRSMYDFRYEEKDTDFYKIQEGLTKDIVLEISEKKGDPAQNLEKLRDYSAQALVEWRLWNEKLS